MKEEYEIAPAPYYELYDDNLRKILILGPERDRFAVPLTIPELLESDSGISVALGNLLQEYVQIGEEQEKQRTRAYLDTAIQIWRRRVENSEEDFHDVAKYYVDAFQSIRLSLLGEILPKENK